MNAVMNDKFLKKLFMMCVISDMYRLIYKPITNQADDERTVDEQEPSFFPPSETFEDSSPSDRDPEINNTLMSLLTDNNFDVSEEPQVSPLLPPPGRGHGNSSSWIEESSCSVSGLSMPEVER